VAGGFGFGVGVGCFAALATAVQMNPAVSAAPCSALSPAPRGSVTRKR
jgi:hypothetical protein